MLILLDFILVTVAMVSMVIAIRAVVNRRAASNDANATGTTKRARSSATDEIRRQKGTIVTVYGTGNVVNVGLSPNDMATYIAHGRTGHRCGRHCRYWWGDPVDDRVITKYRTGNATFGSLVDEQSDKNDELYKESLRLAAELAIQRSKEKALQDWLAGKDIIDAGNKLIADMNAKIDAAQDQRDELDRKLYRSWGEGPSDSE